MVFHLPNQASLRQIKNYTDMFELTLLWNIGLFGMLVTVLFIIFYILKKYQLRLIENHLLRDSMITSDQRTSNRVLNVSNSEAELDEDSIPKTEVKNPTSMFFRVVNVITSFFFYLFWIVVSLIFLTFYMFNFFGRGAYIDVLAVFAMTVIIFIPTIVWKYYTRASNLKAIRGEIIATAILLFLWLAICVFLVVATKGTCVCYFTDKYGIKVDKEGAYLSTDFTRLLTLDKVCKDDEVCHLYATVPADPSTSVFFNAHSGLPLDTLTFVLKKNNETIREMLSDKPYRMDNVESIGQRNVHSVLITGLTANTLYDLEVKNSKGEILKQVGYKTTPGANASVVKIAAGGDLGMNAQAELMTSYLKDFDPDIVILGGDTVYDDALRTCYYSWDVFYSMFRPVYTHLNRLVPIVMSIGNHDVGFDALNPISLPSAKEYLPLFFVYNPQHTTPDGEDVPAIDQRSSSHYHVVGPTLHFNMDSGYIQNYEDQAAHVEEVIKALPGYYLFANYHNPIFPICADQKEDSNDAKVIIQGQKWWVPLFDKHNFTAVFEHHTHYRKMSHRIKNNTKDDFGTRYVGDGSWGVPNGTCSEARTPKYMDLIEDDYAQHDPNHFWQIIINRTDPQDHHINYTAVDINYQVVSKYKDILPPLK